MIAKPPKFVLAFDSFKGSLTSLQVAKAAELGIREHLPSAHIETVAVADGGEGLVDSLVAAMGGVYRVIKVEDPLGRPLNARYAVTESEGEKWAVMEMASASGLPLLRPEERNPWITSTHGTGRMILHALRLGIRHFYLGLGGSATNDGGMGMLSALGVKFYDAHEHLLRGCGADLIKVARIDTSDMVSELLHARFVVACDVDTPFCGPQGATFTFSKQKGASAEMAKRLETGMCHFAKLVERVTQRDMAGLPGSGAAGGLGGALHAFFQAELLPGIDLVLRVTHFNEMLQGAQWVLTGEGCLDAQSTLGKVPLGVLRQAHAAGVPVVAVCGSVRQADEVVRMGFQSVLTVTPQAQPLAEAMLPEVATQNVRRTVSTFVKKIVLSSL